MGGRDDYSRMQLNHSQRGFTLTEMAVVFLIASLLLATAMSTLSSQQERRDAEENTRRLNTAVDAVIGFALVNKRLPCPAVAASSGIESPAGGGTCTTNFSGFLPAQSLGLQPTNSSGYLVDSYGNPIRYAVASAIVAGGGCAGTTPHFTSQANLKANGMSCKPNDIDVVCSLVGAGVDAKCNSTIHVAAAQTVAFIVFSTGKNGANTGNYGADETENTNGDAKFIYHPASDSTSAYGAFDDLMIMVPAGVLYNKLLGAGVLP
jgi:prepilin-type N-terminal cleavage/methylation domain-containing protein